MGSVLYGIVRKALKPAVLFWPKARIPLAPIMKCTVATQPELLLQHCFKLKQRK